MTTTDTIAAAPTRAAAKRALDKIVAHNAEHGMKPFYVPAELRDSKAAETLVAYFTAWLRTHADADHVFRGSSVDALRELVTDDVPAADLYRLRAQLMTMVSADGAVEEVPDEFATYRILVDEPVDDEPAPRRIGAFDELQELVASIANERDSMAAQNAALIRTLESIRAAVAEALPAA